MVKAGTPEQTKDKKFVVLIFIGIIVILIGVYTVWTGGTAGLVDLLWTFGKWIFVALIIGLIIYVVILLFRKEPVDLVANDRKDIIEAGIMSRPPMVRDLYFTGDKEHSEFKLGKIIGYCQLQSYKDLDILAGLTPRQIEELEKQGKIPAEYIIKEDCFIFKTTPAPFSIFEEPKVLRTLEDEHSQLIGDVKVYGVSMLKKFGYFYPNRAHLDIARIDIAVIREAWRGGIHQFLKDFVSITQNAVGLDADYKKNMDQRKLLKIPSPLGNQDADRN
jgi:hypothetical protein